MRLQVAARGRCAVGRGRARLSLRDVLAAARDDDRLVVGRQQKSGPARAALALQVGPVRLAHHRAGLRLVEIHALAAVEAGRGGHCRSVIELLDLLCDARSAHEAILLFVLLEERGAVIGRSALARVERATLIALVATIS